MRFVKMPKKIISLLLTLVLVIALPVLCALNAGAEEMTTVIFEGKTYEVPVGETFVFETRLEAPGYATAGSIIKLQFDRDLLEIVRNSDGDIYETDLEGVLTLGDYTADGKGCSFGCAATRYDSDAILSGDKNLLARFLFRAKAAGTVEIVFLSDAFEFNVFTSASDTTPVVAVVGGKETGAVDSYKFIGNSITVREIEDYQEYVPDNGNGTSSNTGENEDPSAPDENAAPSNGSDDPDSPVSSDDSDGSDVAGNDQNDLNSGNSSEGEMASDDSQISEESGSEGGSSGTVALIAGVILVIAAIAVAVCVVIIKKKKK